MGKPVDVSGIVNGIDKALAAVQEMGKFAQKFEITAPVATIAISAASIGRNIIDKAEQGVIVLSSQDRAKIEASLADLQTANDRLNQAIMDS